MNLQLLKLLKVDRFLSVRNGILAGIIFVSLMMIAGAVLGIGGLTLSTKNMETIFYGKLDPVRILGRINFLMSDNRTQMALALHHNPESPHKIIDGHILENHIASAQINQEEINALWANYTSLKPQAELQELTQDYWSARMDYVNHGLQPMMKMLGEGKFNTAEKHLLEKVNPLYEIANAKSEKLLAYLTKEAEWSYQEAAQRNKNISTIAIFGITIGLSIIVISGFLFFQGTVQPLNTSVQALEKIAAGDLSGNFEKFAYGEPGRVTASVLTMQSNLKMMIKEIKTSSYTIQQQCQQMNHTVMNLVQQFEEQHDRVYQALDISNASAAHLREQTMKIQTAIQDFENNTVSNLSETPQMHLINSFTELAASMGMDVFSAEETSAQMNQIAMLIVENREEVQKAWSASEQLRDTSHELDRLVGRFTT